MVLFRSLLLLVVGIIIAPPCLEARLMMSSMSSSSNDEDEEAVVSVRFYGEAQCPYCRRFVTDVWQSIWTDPEFRAVIDYDFVPWGNAYFATKECGEGPRYDSTERKCWAKNCIPATDAGKHETTADDDNDDDNMDCFAGPAIYQHSTKEGQVDIYESCVKELLGLDAAVDFTYCCEGPHMDDDATLSTARALMETCVRPSFESDAVHQCLEERGRELEIANAKQTPPHPGVPYVVVDGTPLREDPMAVGDAICASLKEKGIKEPSACATMRTMALASLF
jgi:hypothetical protein